MTYNTNNVPQMLIEWAKQYNYANNDKFTFTVEVSKHEFKVTVIEK